VAIGTKHGRPTYFPPETIQVGEHRFVFVDGGVTMYNNPAFQLYLMARSITTGRTRRSRAGWPTGPDKMLIVHRHRTSPGANGSSVRTKCTCSSMHRRSRPRSCSRLNEQDFLPVFAAVSRINRPKSMR
jgi:hypothetical protein